MAVEYKPLWELTAWDKKFKGVEKEKRTKQKSFHINITCLLILQK